MTRHFSARHWLIGWLSCLAVSLGGSVVRADPSVDAERAEILRELTHERRHLFQSAGLFDRVSWKVA